MDYFTSFVQAMPYDLFLKLVFDSQIWGKDLFSLCLTNTTINKKCNHREGKLFRSLLKEEYPQETSPKELRDFYFEYFQAKVWTFGRGRYGELGHGDREDHLRPKMIEGFSGIKAVACGSYHTVFLL